MTTGKTIALTRWTFVSKVISLLFHILSRLVIDFLPRSKHLLISWLQSPSAVIFGAPKNKVSHCFHCFPIYLPWSNGTTTLVTSWEELTHWKRLWSWEGLGTGGKGDNRGWDVWMASPARYTCLFESTLGVGDEQGSLVCCDLWGHQGSDTTEWLNWTELNVL